MMAAVSMAQTPTVSASSVTLKYCLTTYGTVHVVAKSDLFPINYDGFSFSNFGEYVRKLENVRGCDSVVTYIVEKNTQGVLSGKFSVNSAGKQVQFAKGNLMYLASNGITYPNEGCLSHQTKTGTAAGIWRFGDEQYSACGKVTANSSPSSTQTSWMDLFSSGHTGYSSYAPTSKSSGPGSDNAGNYDWGYFNAIQNGGNVPGLWRLLSVEEWNYMISRRPSASDKYAFVKINNSIRGLMILPDEWTLPSGCPWRSGFSQINYTYAQWQQMEAAGAVFLIADYYGSNYYIEGDGKETYYFLTNGSANVSSTQGVQIIYFNSNRSHVRLVCDVE